jgi:hypothetical protein
MFRQYFDGLNTVTGTPLLAVRYAGTSDEPENIPVGDVVVTRRRVTVIIEFFDSPVGRDAAHAMGRYLKLGTKRLDDLRYESFLYPETPERMKEYLEQKYQDTLEVWDG